ncbi:MAG: translocation/assembly module TamB domain-containing protein [Gammaproteobacteria bacterium]|nr:translocation/assembly module TamB domain-containing protein [Gammaproteobacteria bacterium]
MIRRIARWFSGIAFGALLICVAVIFWLVATESGTRWLLAKAVPVLPGEISIASVDGTLLRGVQLNSINWHDASLLISVDSVRTQFELRPLLRRNLIVSLLDVRVVSVSVADRSDSDRDTESFALDLPIDVSLAGASITDIRVQIDDSEYRIDQIKLGGRLSGPELDLEIFSVGSDLGDIELSGNMRLASPYESSLDGLWTLRMPEQPSLAGHLVLSGNSSRYEIQHDLTEPYAIATTGSIAVTDEELHVNVQNTWQLVNIPTADGRSIAVRDGSFYVDGTNRQFTFDGSATVETAATPPLSVSLSGNSDSQQIVVQSISVASDLGHLTANGSIMIVPELNWDLSYEIADIDPAVIDQTLGGRLHLQGTSTGRIVDQRVFASAAMESLAGNLNGYPVKGTAALTYADEVLRFKNARVDVGDNHAVFDGSYGTALDVNAALRLPDISQLLVDATGAVNGELRLSSGPSRAALTGDLEMSSLTWQDYSVDHLETRFALPMVGAGRIALRARHARIGQNNFESVSIDGNGSARSHELAAQIDSPIGRAELQATGQYVEKRWSGSVESLSVRGDALGEWVLQQTSGVSVSVAAVNVEQFCLAAVSPAGIACFELNFEEAGPLRFSTSVSGLPLAALPMNLPEASSIAGVIEADANGEFLDQRLNANANINIPNLGLRAVYEDDEITADFDLATFKASIVDNRLDAELQLAATDKSARASANIGLADILDGRSPVTGGAALELSDLSLISFLYPDVTKTAGHIGGRVDVSGSMAAPEFVGEIVLRDGAFEVRRTGVAVTDVSLRLRQLETGRLSLGGTAKSGEGHLSVTGATTLTSTEGIRTQLTLEGDNFALLRLPEWQLAASPSIDVVLDDRAARISGKLGIPNASITLHEVPDTAEQASADVIVHRADETQKTVRRELFVDVRTVLGESVSLSAFGLTTGLEGAVRISGGSKSPYAGAGRLVLREGHYKAYGQNLQIERGELIFNGPLDNPVLDIRATRTASDGVVAGLHLTGTPAQPRSEVFSDPVLGDAESLSYLLTGRPLVSANAEQGDMLNQAAFALGLSTAGSVVSRISDQLGLDTLAVRGGSGQQQLVAGKQFGRRLLVEYAYGIVDNLGTLLLRYQLNSRIVLESRSGSVNNVDVVYSVKKN